MQHNENHLKSTTTTIIIIIIIILLNLKNTYMKLMDMT